MTPPYEARNNNLLKKRNIILMPGGQNSCHGAGNCGILEVRSKRLDFWRMIMKQTKRLFSLFLSLMILLGCLAPGAGAASGDDFREKLEAQYQALLPDLGIRRAEWDAELESCTEEEKTIMQYYFITTTMSDLCSIDFSLLHRYAAHAAMLRETMPWTKALEEDTFLCYVASYRVFKEPIVDCREFFYEQLSGEIAGKSLTEAALLVNKWCGQQATYASTDQREASPLGMYNGGGGRCGEEANFAVNVLRSVGIPARVCNVDWTVVMDGHAFPQVLVEDTWHFMGACEPEAVLDSGWFTGRLGSLLTAFTYSWSDIGVGQPTVSWDGLSIANDIASFADAKELTLTVLDEQGQPAPNVPIDLVLVQQEVLLNTLVTLHTDEAGQARCPLGLGSVAAIAYHGGSWRGAWIAQEQTEATLSFAQEPEYNVWYALPVQYNEADAKNIKSATQEENEAFFGGENYNDVRAENHAGDFDPERAAHYPDCEDSLRSAGRNFSQLISFLEADDDPLRSSLVAGLSDKYCREVSAQVLEDLLQGAKNAAGELGDQELIDGLLYPVYEWSYFTPQRLAVQQLFTQEELEAFRADPAALVQWFDENIHADCLRASQGGVPALSGGLRMGYCPDGARTTMLMELARAVGIPVMQDQQTGQWFSLGSDGWAPADWCPDAQKNEENAAYGTAEYLTAGSEAYMGLNWAIIGLSGQEEYDYYYYWTIEEIDTDTQLQLPVGDYAMILLDMREEKSGILYFNRFTVEDGGTTTICLPS